MGLFGAIVRRKPKVYDYQGTAQAEGYGADVAINGRKREVILFRPPTILDANGTTVPGVKKEMIGNYMVATVSSLSGVDLGIVDVDWLGQVGRFALANLKLVSWGQQMRLMAPVNVISQPLNNVMETYRAAICRKASEIHKGHQDYRDANRLLERAEKALERLRDDDYPHLSDAEFLFVASEIAAAKVRNALIPLHTEDGEQVVQTESRVIPEAGRAAMVTEGQGVRA